MERPIQSSILDIDVSYFSAYKTIENRKNIYFQKNNKQSLIKLMFYNDSSYDCSKIDNKIVPDFVFKMLLEGTKKYSYKQISEIIDFYGVYLRSFYGRDSSQISMLVMSNKFDDVFDVFYEILLEPNFEKDRLEHLKKLDLQNLQLENIKNSTIANKEFFKTIFGGNHHYGYVRTAEDISKVEIKDLKEYYDQYLVDGWKCLISGDISDQTIDKVSDNFRSLLQPHKNVYCLQINEIKPKTIIIEKDSQQEYIYMGKICIPPQHRDYKILWCCVMFLGGYFGSRLMMNIREKGGYTYGIHAFLGVQKYCSYVCIKTSVKKHCSENVFEEIKNEINKLQNIPASEEELNSFKQYMIGEMISDSSTPFNTVKQFHSLDIINAEKDFYSVLAKMIINLTPEQIMNTAKEYLDINTMSIVVLK